MPEEAVGTGGVYPSPEGRPHVRRSRRSAAVTREAVRELGFDGGDGQVPCRWVAVRHGRSGAGNDRVHLVVNLVREDGKVASTDNDFKRLSAFCAAKERRYRLMLVAPTVGRREGATLILPAPKG
jgi:hypothetical protein